MIDARTLKRLWPKASAQLISAVVDADFDSYGISTPLRLAHFMAQISHESNGGTISVENMNYTTAARIAAVWPTRFNTQTAEPYVRNARSLANNVYNGRMGNRIGSDDGYNYRGRGLLQLTGRDSYIRIGTKLGLDLEGNPDLAAVPTHAIAIAMEEFVSLGCLPFCDKDDIRSVTKRVNGGIIGLTSRIAWLTKWKAAFPDLPGALPVTAQGIASISEQMPRGAELPPTAQDPIDKWIERASVAGPVVTTATAGWEWKAALAIGGCFIVGLVVMFFLKRRWAT